MTASRKIVEKAGKFTELNEAITRDGFHRGAFEALQFKSSGHRSGMDALLLAASLAQDSAGTLADLGAGTGVAGLAALNLNPQLDLVVVEKNPQLVALAMQSLDLPANTNFHGRVKFFEADVTLSGYEREHCGLKPNSVDHVIMNPPYNSHHLRASPDHQKVEAHVMGDVMGEGGLDSWLRTAAAITRPGGTLALVYRTRYLGAILACCQSRFGGLEILPIHSRAHDPSLRMIIRGTRASNAPLAIVPGITVHDADGRFTPQAMAIFDGMAHLDFAG